MGQGEAWLWSTVCGTKRWHGLSLGIWSLCRHHELWPIGRKTWLHLCLGRRSTGDGVWERATHWGKESAKAHLQRDHVIAKRSCDRGSTIWFATAIAMRSLTCSILKNWHSQPSYQVQITDEGWSEDQSPAVFICSTVCASVESGLLTLHTCETNLLLQESQVRQCACVHGTSLCLLSES